MVHPAGLVRARQDAREMPRKPVANLAPATRVLHPPAQRILPQHASDPRKNRWRIAPADATPPL